MNLFGVDFIYTNITLRIFSKCKQKNRDKNNTFKNLPNEAYVKSKENMKDTPLEISEPKRFSRKDVIGKIPVWEAWTYTLYMTAIMVISGYALYLFSSEIEHDVEYNYLLGIGWSFVGRYKDFRMGTWRVLYDKCYTLIAIIGLHIASSVIANRYIYHYRRHVWTIVGMFSVSWLLGWKVVINILGNVIIFYAVSRARNLTLCYLTCLSIIAIKNNFKSHVLTLMNVSDTGDSTMYTILYGFLILRLSSFSIESVMHHKRTSDLDPAITFSFFDLLAYTFYIPCLITGPVVIYKYFQPQVIKDKRSWEEGELFYICQKCVRVILVVIVMDGLLHLIYVHTIGMKVELLRTAPLWCIGGLVLYTGCMYQSKSVVLYGFPSCLIMLDHIVPPTNPRCIFRVGVYTDHWRFFDPGLHAFFRNYIYIPIGGSRRGLLRQILGSYACFLFVWFWHRARYNRLVYLAINASAFTIDVLSKNFMRSEAFNRFQKKYQSPAAVRRLYGVLNTPVYILSTFSITLFFTDLQQAWIMLDRLILHGSAWSIALTCFMCYSAIMFSSEIDRLEMTQIQHAKAD